MSDGPHRSLPLKERWRRISACMSNSSFSDDELVVELAAALSDEFPRASIEAVKSILLPIGQGSLFVEDRTEALDALGHGRPGCAATIALVECAKEAMAGSSHPADALTALVQMASMEVFDAHARSIEEHYVREIGRASGVFMRDRFADTRDACVAASASRLLGRSGPAAPVRLSDLDHGPALP